ncbi:MAG: hypothetical protein AUK34_04970 [Ignavibacteria bacterium CG2_30_36_16]|nr:MAG: hypothetical protein AUK34_04970 [Ignavibacteria bacterium CG2_30_36_16]
MNTWIPFLYLYGVGGIFFYSGMFIVKKCGGLDLSKKRHRFWRNVLYFGFFYFVAIHAVWTLVALYF